MKMLKLQRIYLLIKNNKLPISVCTVLLILSDIFLLSNSSDIRTYGFLAIAFIAIMIYKLSSKLLFSFCLFLLIAMFIMFLISGASIITEKAATWFFLSFCVASIRQWKE